MNNNYFLKKIILHKNDKKFIGCSIEGFDRKNFTNIKYVYGTTGTE